MSNAGKRGEIEDVLSAIRRLLAEDTSGGNQAEVRAVTERLVLTQDHRAMERSDSATDSAPTIEDALAALEAAVAAHTTPLRAVEPVDALPQDTDIEEAADEAPFIAIDEPEPHVAETISFRQGAMRRFQLVRTSFSSVPEQGEEDREGPLPDAEATAAPAVEDIPEDADAEEPVAQVTSEEAPDFSIEEPEEENERAEFTEPHLADAQDLPDESPDDDAFAATDEVLSAGIDGVPDLLDAEVARDEVALADDEDLGEDDWDAGDEDDTLFAEDSPLLDPEMLRELVSEILREELQGPLGERMTRNVRKLVRAEIRRALAGRELE